MTMIPLGERNRDAMSLLSRSPNLVRALLTPPYSPRFFLIFPSYESYHLSLSWACVLVTGFLMVLFFFSSSLEFQWAVGWSGLVWLSGWLIGLIGLGWVGWMAGRHACIGGGWWMIYRSAFYLSQLELTIQSRGKWEKQRCIFFVDLVFFLSLLLTLACFLLVHGSPWLSACQMGDMEKRRCQRGSAVRQQK